MKKQNSGHHFLFIIASIFLFSYATFPFALVSVCTFCFIGTIFLLNFKVIKNNIFNKVRIKTFIILTSWLFYLFTTIIYSDNWEYGFKLILRYLSLILIIFMFVFGFTKRILSKSYYFYLAFILSNFFFTLFIYFKAITIIEVTCYPEIYYKSIIQKIQFLFSKPNHIIFACFENQYDHSFFIHRVYDSMFYLFSVLLIIEVLWKRNINKLIKVFLIIIGFWFIYLIYYQFSTVNVFLTLIVLPAFLFFKTKEIRFKSFKIYLYSLIFVISVFGIIIVKTNHSVAIDQLEPVINMLKKMSGGVTSGEIDERYEINKANKKLFIDKPILGYGLGDVQDVLNDYYFSHKKNSKIYFDAYLRNLNSHNYYYFLLLSGGTILFLLYVFCFLFLTKLSLNEKDFLFFFFLIIFGVNLLFENILSRIHGILFYSIFTGLFLSNYLNKNEDFK